MVRRERRWILHRATRARRQSRDDALLPPAPNASRVCALGLAWLLFHRLARGVAFVAGGLLFNQYGGLALGSWLATLIAGVPMILLCRTLLEDKMLREELAGYEEYAAQVKYRLALGIW